MDNQPPYRFSSTADLSAHASCWLMFLSRSVM